MTQKDKELLFRDLCARLPYGVKGNYKNSNDELLRKVPIIYRYLEPNGMVMTGDIKPYLFPLSSMTEEQMEEYAHVVVRCGTIGSSLLTHMSVEDWLNKNHFDYRGLIPMNLAIDATGLKVYKL